MITQNFILNRLSAALTQLDWVFASLVKPIVVVWISVNSRLKMYNF